MSCVRRLVAALLLLAAPALAAGPDDGLYPPPPPTGTAYLRYIGEGSLDVGNLQLIGARYMPLMQGSYTAAHEANSVPVQLEADRHYTVVAGEGGQLVFLPDPELENRARALLAVYNLTDQPALNLVTADGKLTVVEGIGLKAVGSRMVQPVKASLALAANGNILTSVDTLTLESNTVYTIIASGSGAAITATIIKDGPD